MSHSLAAGMKNTHAVTTKTPTNAQNTDQLQFPFIFATFSN
jgi:hypothetical protein